MTIDCIKEQILEKYSCINKILHYKNQYSCIDKMCHDKNLKILTNKCQQYLNLYEDLCFQVLGYKNPFTDKKNLVAEAIYYGTLSHYKQKIKTQNYYRGNCSAFNIVMQNIIVRLQNKSIQESTSRKLKGLIRKCLYDSLRLIDDYQKKNNNTPFFSTYLTNNPDYSLYYDTCEQIIFGEGNFDDSSDQSEVTPTLIRVMIELRLKWSMGISRYLVSSSPGNMSQFLEVYKQFIENNKIIVALQFDTIKKIYEWGNIYVHTGTRSYAWLTPFTTNLLEPLFYGKQHRWSGVMVESQATIYEFWDRLKENYIQRSDNKKIKVEIQPYIPGFICTDKNYKPIPCKNHYYFYENSLSKVSSGSQIEAAYKMKCILQEGIQTIGNSLHKRAKESYVTLRKQEIRERAYYLWLKKGATLWDAETDWYNSIKDDIEFLQKPS